MAVAVPANALGQIECAQRTIQLEYIRQNRTNQLQRRPFPQ